MSKIAILTDSNSGITPEEAKELGIFVVPMPFIIDGEEYFENITLSQEEFYEKLKSNVNISTSQPSIGALEETYEDLLKVYDYIIHMPMSSALSKSFETASNLAKNYDNKVFVIDNKKISVTLKQACIDAVNMINDGKNVEEIVEWLNQTANLSSIYITVNTLKYLKKGGRITPAAALIGAILSIKPVLQIQGGKLDKYTKVTNMLTAKQKMIEAIKNDLSSRFKEYDDKGLMTLSIAHTNNYAKAIEFKEDIMKEFPNHKINFIDPLSLSVSCHIGDGSLALVTTIEYKK